MSKCFNCKGNKSKQSKICIKCRRSDECKMCNKGNTLIAQVGNEWKFMRVCVECFQKMNGLLEITEHPKTEHPKDDLFVLKSDLKKKYNRLYGSHFISDNK